MKRETCFICTEEIRIYAIGSCNHPICHSCNLRLRALYKNKTCPYCKLDQPDIIYSLKSLDYTTVLPQELVKRDLKLGIRFTQDSIYEETMKLLQFNCPSESCDTVCGNGWEELKVHVSQSHGKSLCPICIQNKKVFAHEHSMYTKKSLSRHYEIGDADDPSFKGHPFCGFCKSHFYGKDELFEHCRSAHETCFLCKQRGIVDVYYENYSSLEKHFDEEHYLCKERECLDKKFVVFDSDIDMRAHDTKEHPSKVKKGKSVAIELNFRYGPRQSQNGNREQSMSLASSHSGVPTEPFQSLNLESRPMSHRAPSDFGTLLTVEKTVEKKATEAQETPSKVVPTTPPTLGGDPEIAFGLQKLFQSKASSLEEFKSLAKSFRSRVLTADEFLEGFMSLATQDCSSGEWKKQVLREVGKIWIRLSETVPAEDSFKESHEASHGTSHGGTSHGKGKKKKTVTSSQSNDMLRAWNNYKAKNANEISAWDTPSHSHSSINKTFQESQNTTSKILVIKPSSSGQGKLKSRFLPTPNVSSQSRMASALPAMTTRASQDYKTPWTQSSTANSLEGPNKGDSEEFPQLPSSSARSPLIHPSMSTSQSKDWIQETLENSQGKKKKRGKTVLMQFG